MLTVHSPGGSTGFINRDGGKCQTEYPKEQLFLHYTNHVIVGLTPPGYLPPLALEAAGLRDPMTFEHGDRSQRVK